MRIVALILSLVLSVGVVHAQTATTTKVCDANTTSCTPYGTTYPEAITGNTNVATYSAGSSFSNSTASAGDLFCVNGSASKAVKVKGIRVTGVGGGAGSANAALAIIRRSTADTGGTPTSLTAVPSDSNNPAATGTVTQYGGANLPTPGTTVGNVRNRYISLPGTSSVGVSEGLFQFSVYWDQPQVLRGTAQGICVNSVANSASWAIDVEWSEE